MKNSYLLLFLFGIFQISNAQLTSWQTFTDSIPTLSSPRACDLNNDGIKDIVIGGGTDGVASNNGIMAFNGANGSLLWKRGSRNEVFGSPIFYDINNDGIKDVFITGRQAQLLAINGSNGELIWDYFPYASNPADSGLYNFYNPQFIPDVNGDQMPDILVANGGNHAAPDWETDRPPGHLMVINSMNGQLLAKAVVPDSAETYCSPLVADIQGNGDLWVLYGTGGENLGGSFWACPLNDLVLSNSLANSIALDTDSQKGFIAPAALCKTVNGGHDIIIQSFGGKIKKIKGVNFGQTWQFQLPNTESSAEPVLGNFVGGDNTPDVLAILFKGIAPSYSDFYQVLIDGSTGQMTFKDSLGKFNYVSANALDFDNNGRDEGLVSITYLENGTYKHRLQKINFNDGNISQVVSTKTGVNIGSTP
jgi:outer membrane protein assembly factor BamB